MANRSLLPTWFLLFLKYEYCIMLSTVLEISGKGQRQKKKNNWHEAISICPCNTPI
jgi:hypothetical protein